VRNKWRGAREHCSQNLLWHLDLAKLGK
jgi:hypothetical protein